MKKQCESELVIRVSEADETAAVRAIFRCIDSIRKEQNEKQQTKCFRERGGVCPFHLGQSER